MGLSEHLFLNMSSVAGNEADENAKTEPKY